MSKTVSRRGFVKIVARGMAATILSGAPPLLATAAPSPYETLITGQFANSLRLKHVSGRYLALDYSLTDTPTTWVLQIGEYKGMLHHDAVDYNGYWIFNPDGKHCWQDDRRNNNRLVNWNEDGKAFSYPQDWELFRFEKVDAAQRTVKIQNAVPNGSYIGLVGNKFNCDQVQGKAAVFVVEFASDDAAVSRVRAERQPPAPPTKKVPGHPGRLLL